NAMTLIANLVADLQFTLRMTRKSLGFTVAAVLSLALGNHTGTGVGHVIAMMYVLVTAEEPRIILIDEPQSFLHPRAVRRLIGVFKLMPEHQFIISTHSPQV